MFRISLEGLCETSPTGGRAAANPEAPEGWSEQGSLRNMALKEPKGVSDHLTPLSSVTPSIRQVEEKASDLFTKMTFNPLNSQLGHLLPVPILTT